MADVWLRCGFRMGPPPMVSYGGDGPGYDELGKMQGEQQQFRQDELMDRGGQYDYPDRTTGSSARDGDFGGDQGSDNSGAGRGD